MSETKKTNDAKKTTKSKKKEFTANGKEKVYVTKAGGGISAKNWLIMIVICIIVFGAGFYFGQLSKTGTVNKYKTEAQEYKQKLELVNEVIGRNVIN